MIQRTFLDTNVFVYTLDSRSPKKAAAALSIVEQGITSGFGTVSYQLIHEFFNAALRKFSHAMSPADAREYQATVFQRMKVVPQSQSVINRALDLHASHSRSWFDSLIVSAAIEAGCGELLSEDLQHGQRFDSLVVVNPFLHC